ncbi:putative quinol monooxygenase [Sphingopyxis sp.]|uniref:putative quinol monooxygenase n=1 Tax=Sphingopyxis sp. TaxID=1908224 RepID=UPI003D6CCBB2
MPNQSVTLLATMEARPDCADKMCAALTDARAASRAEDGCVIYELMVDGTHHNFLVFERWRDKAAFRAHQSSAHLAETAQRLEPLLARPPEFVPWRMVS